MSHPACDLAGIRYSRQKSRLTPALLSLLVAVGCSKSAGNQDTGSKPAAKGTDTVGAMQPEGAPPAMKAAGGGNEMAAAEPASGGAAAAGDDQFRLRPEEGKLSIEVPADAKSGTEVTAKVFVTPAGPYKINKEFPTKLTLESPEGVTIAKAKLTAGGAEQAKGDADAFEDKQLAFTVKLTPSKSGNHTVNGTFKFAVCDKDTCLAKKEQISIALAAQ